MNQAKASEAAWTRFAGLGLVYALGFGGGLLGLLYATRRFRPRRPISIGPGAMAAAESDLRQPPAEAVLRVGMSIAVGIGCTTSPRAWPLARLARQASCRWRCC
jgi:hypothetical protein